MGCLFCQAIEKRGNQHADLPFICPQCRHDLLIEPQDMCRRCCFPSRGPGGYCPACWRALPPFNRALAAGVYTGHLRDLIIRFKFHGEKALAIPLGKLMSRQVIDLLNPPDLIIPVPLHTKRLASRGFNQAELLSRVLSGYCRAPVATGILNRHRPTVKQSELDRSARLDNVRGSFIVCDPWRLTGKAVLLVDDVYTTGATVIGCTQELLKVGARRVDVCVAAVDI